MSARSAAIVTKENRLPALRSQLDKLTVNSEDMEEVMVGFLSRFVFCADGCLALFSLGPQPEGQSSNSAAFFTNQGQHYECNEEWCKASKA